MVLHGYFLHIATTHAYIRFLDLSEQQIKDVTGKFPLTMLTKWDFREICYLDSIVVTTSGEVFLVRNNLKRTNIESGKSFRLSKKDPNVDPDRYSNLLIEVDSLGDEEALLLDLGFTLPGIEPNSIYFSRDDRYFCRRDSKLDICVFNLETKTLKRFPSLSNMKLKDARWFVPGI
ncbi:unnamed protein product [Arabidopsis arenosa]|uniref:KIB1-4 beta-propeller domain-containing protein n=1 Tax=Arabidopsis arenosa TaxID=38785 RepID=A0A8S2A031_ARAAE|nr:unnamed protein product [Arabidopsis arenosa]